MRQTEVSLAMRYLAERGLIRFRECESQSKGRPAKIYEPAKPIPEIIDGIGEEKKAEVNTKPDLVRKLWYPLG